MPPSLASWPAGRATLWHHRRNRSMLHGRHALRPCTLRADWARPARRSGGAPPDVSQQVRADSTTINTQRLRTVRTFSPKDSDITRRWHVIDASDVVLGRLASHVAVLLRGKHKPIFAPHVDTGDFVIVVNASKVALSGSKLQDKKAYRHSGYP